MIGSIIINTEFELNNKLTLENKVLMLFIGLSLVGIIGYIESTNDLLSFIFAHAGGLGIIGIIGSLTANIAKNKGYSYLITIVSGIILPVSLGFFTFILLEKISCGGSPSLAGSLLILIIFSFKKSKNL